MKKLTTVIDMAYDGYAIVNDHWGYLALNG
jgi:hypothetical protein